MLQAGTPDGLVLIIENEITSITRRELRAATDAGAPIFVMLKAGVERDAELELFIKRARTHATTTVNFSSSGELKTRIAKGLRTWAIRSGRSHMLQMRERADGNAAADTLAMEDYRGVEVSAGVGGSMITITDLVEEAHQLVDADEAAQALEKLWLLAQGAYDVGLGWLSLKLLDEIERVVPPAAIDDHWRGWLCNTRGLALSRGQL